MQQYEQRCTSLRTDRKTAALTYLDASSARAGRARLPRRRPEGQSQPPPPLSAVHPST